MTTYIITINCPKYGNKDVTIKADSEDEAKIKISNQYPNCEILQLKLLLLD